MSYFCALPPYRPKSQEQEQSREEDAMISLAYSLILQLISQMSPEIKSSINLATSRLNKLNGCLESWNESLSLLVDLLHHFPLPLLLCVIDGLGRLDFRYGAPLCGQLVYVLQDYMGSTTTGTRLKILFATSGVSSGQSAALPKLIPDDHRLYVDQAQGKYGPLTRGQNLDISTQLSHILISSGQGALPSSVPK